MLLPIGALPLWRSPAVGGVAVTPKAWGQSPHTPLVLVHAGVTKRFSCPNLSPDELHNVKKSCYLLNFMSAVAKAVLSNWANFNKKP